MSRAFDAYRALHDQGFLPIFVDDDIDSRMLLDGCLQADLRVVEYTLRRRDAHRMIPWIRERYPALFLLVGSTLDDEMIVRAMKRQHPQLLTIDEMDAMGVDGFVSMIGWSRESIERYSPTRLVIPGASTVTEAFVQVSAGAHFAKVCGPDFSLLRQCRLPPTFGYCPLYATGGLTTGRLPEAVDSGAVVIASGFDVTLSGLSGNLDCEGIAAVMRRYVDAVRTARAAKWPQLAAAEGKSRQVWLDALPHYHPF